MQNLIDYIQNVSDDEIYLVYLIVIFISYLIYLVTNRIILKSISHFFKQTSTYVDDILIEKKVFNKIPYLIPLIFIYNLKDLLPWFRVVERILLSFIALIILISLNAFINALSDVYSRSKFSNKLNIKSYIQVLKLIVNMLGIFVIVAFLIGKSPVYLLSGIGALTAVLLLVFKDTILSLISSIQISSNNLFKIGDWVEAPQFGADGNVIDIALHSVKIQNWDKTISIIPTNKLIDSSFKNWRGMSESGGRRIKRSIKIDMNSIKFCSDSMIEKFKRFNVITDYILSKLIEIEKYNLVFSIEKIAPFKKCSNSILTEPWLMYSSNELHPREKARLCLGLEANDRRQLIVVCWAGNQDDIHYFYALAEKLKNKLDQCNVIFNSPVFGLSHLNAWPLLKYIQGIDALVGEGGYNLVHESRQTKTPLFSQPKKRLYDDQYERLVANECYESIEDLVFKLRSCSFSKKKSEFENGLVQSVKLIESF